MSKPGIHSGDKFEKFHEYNCLIPERIVYFGSEDGDEFDGETGVDYASARVLILNLLYLNSLNTEPITIHWNSPGGCWYRGMGVYDVIKSIQSPVAMIGFGMVRSMGTVIMQACTSRVLAPNCDFMIHDGEEGWYGTPKSFEAWGRYSKTIRERMYDIYLKNIHKKLPNFTRKRIEDMCSHDCILSGKETVDLGLADEVIE